MAVYKYPTRELNTVECSVCQDMKTSSLRSGRQFVTWCSRGHITVVDPDNRDIPKQVYFFKTTFAFNRSKCYGVRHSFRERVDGMPCECGAAELKFSNGGWGLVPRPVTA